MTSDVGHLFICLLATPGIILEKESSGKINCHFFSVRFMCFLAIGYSCMFGVLFIRYIVGKYFSYFLGCLLSYLFVPFAMQTFLLDEIPFALFCFCLYALGVIKKIKKLLSRPMFPLIFF